VPQLLKVNDVAWLYAESYRQPMQVGMLATFTLPDDADGSYLTDLVARWRSVRTFSPPFNYAFRGPLPHWRTLGDDEIDLDHHFHHSALPAPGGQRALGVLVSRLHSQRMDRRYPLWEVYVIEGVGPRTWSLYIKLHHSQVDGVGGLRMAKRILSIDPTSRGMLPPWAVGTQGTDQSGVPAPPLVETTGGELGRSWLEGLRSVGGSLARTYGETLAGSMTSLRAVPYHAPKAAFNGRITASRRFATQHWEIDRLRAVATAADASLNDVFLAATGGGLRRYLADLGRLPIGSLTASVPVSVRAEGEDGVGNALTFLWAKLGTDIGDPITRLEAVRESTRLGKQRIPTASSTVMDAYTVLLMLPVLGQAITGAGGVGPPAFNVVVSNVPGFTEQRYLDGSPLAEYYPLSLLFHGQGLNITAISNAGWFCIGYTGARDAVPHLQRIAVASGQALEELEAAYGTAGRFDRSEKVEAEGVT
jgi:diacylglycerol O-acyltransferase / wax synthase